MSKRETLPSSSSATSDKQKKKYIIEVEYCEVWNYKPRFEILQNYLNMTYPGYFEFETNLRAPRLGAFEVILK